MNDTMKAAEFKAKCLEAMDHVAKTGTKIVITKRGVPVAELGPVTKKPKTLRGFMKGRIKSHGDITGPLDVEWEANS